MAPQSGCKVAVSQRGPLVLKKATDKNKLSWRWIGSTATAPAELGDPTTATAYSFCVYDGVDALVIGVQIPAGGLCFLNGYKTCWGVRKDGFAYKSRLPGSVDGATILKLKAGAANRSRMKLKAKGPNVVLPTLPLVQSPKTVRAQLVNSNGVCWETSYSGRPLSRLNDAVKWKDKND